MTDVTEIDGPTDATLDNHRYMLMQVEAPTWIEACQRGAHLVGKVKFELASRALVENVLPTIIWRQRPYLTSVTDLADGAITYYVKFTLLTVPEIPLGAIAINE